MRTTDGQRQGTRRLVGRDDRMVSEARRAGDRVYGRIGDAIREAFERPDMNMAGLSFALIVYADENLPTELAAGLSQHEAERAASRLREAGAEIEVVPTESVSELRYRASDVWPDRCAGRYCFKEVDGLLLVMLGLNTLENLRIPRSHGPDSPNWRLESAMNHSHPGNGSTYAEMHESQLRAIEDVRAALVEAYPDRAFTISQWIGGDRISFWQTTPDSPHDEYPPSEQEEPRQTAWCQHCSRERRFRPADMTDPRFTEAEWGICEECGAEILVRSYEKLTFVSPGGGR